MREDLFVVLFVMLMTTTGEVSTLSVFADGNGKTATFSNPQGICFDEKSQSVLVCDYINDKLHRVQLNGILPSHPPPSLFIFLSGHLLQEE